MKLQLGNVVIETDNIEYTEKIDNRTVDIYFISGIKVEVDCDDFYSTNSATWDGDTDNLIQVILEVDSDKDE